MDVRRLNVGGLQPVPTEPPKSLQDFTARDWQDLVAAAVFRGALKAIVVASLLGTLVGFLLYVIHLT